jgi:hypothetical protein
MLKLHLGWRTLSHAYMHTDTHTETHAAHLLLQFQHRGRQLTHTQLQLRRGQVQVYDGGLGGVPPVLGRLSMPALLKDTPAYTTQMAICLCRCGTSLTAASTYTPVTPFH